MLTRERYTLSVYPHRASLKICLTTVGIEPTTFGILAQCSAKLSYAVWSVRVWSRSGHGLVRGLVGSNRPDRVAQLAEHWASIPKVVGSIPTVVRHIFKLARCGYTLRVTSQASYSPEYITPTQKNQVSHVSSRKHRES